MSRNDLNDAPEMAREATTSTGHDILRAAIVDDISASITQHKTPVQGQGVKESTDEADHKKKYTGVDSAGNLSEGYLDLATIPPDTNICGDVDDAGRFRLPLTLLNRAGAGYQEKNYRLDERYLVSLVLTQACYELGRGKVSSDIRHDLLFHRG